MLVLPGQRPQQRDVLVVRPLHLPALQLRYLLALARGDESEEHQPCQYRRLRQCGDGMSVLVPVLPLR